MEGFGTDAVIYLKVRPAGEGVLADKAIAAGHTPQSCQRGSMGQRGAFQGALLDWAREGIVELLSVSSAGKP